MCKIVCGLAAVLLMLLMMLMILLMMLTMLLTMLLTGFMVSIDERELRCTVLRVVQSILHCHCRSIVEVLVEVWYLHYGTLYAMHQTP